MENPNFHLEGILKDKNGSEDFEGPLSLILMLLSKNKIEIRDIKIAEILDQYMDYLAQMESMDLEIASEFIQMAAHLLYIKTRTLLTNDDEEEVTELELLMASLEQLKAKDRLASLQKILPEMKSMSELGFRYHEKAPEPLRPLSREYNYSIKAEDLLKALKNVFGRSPKHRESEQFGTAIPHRIIYSIKDKSRQILELLRAGDVTLNELYMMCATRSEIVASFMSVLELCSMGNIAIDKNENDYSLRFIGGDMDEIIEKITE